MDGQDAIVFCVHDKQTGVVGYTWYIESHRTSFYIKSTMKALQTVKVSVHGPDPNHIGKQHFRLDWTSPKEAQKAINAGGGWMQSGQTLPFVFAGRPVNRRTVHLARFSFEFNMFRKGVQRGPDPVTMPKATLHGRIDAPPEGRVTHVELYLSRVRPFWRNSKELEIRAANAGIGPLINEAGMFLTAIIDRKDAATAQRDPFGDVSEGLPAGQLTRGVAAGVDQWGLLWICEKMMPRSKLTSTTPPPRPPLMDGNST
ncbi:hypothetical protein [Mycobacterium avium]|uniref:hypothetical protein n=1 Tax=Mycobacterium avium TaxID=1764 RepID=UPI0007A03ADD|nr:hypothetical protein [Mycobacterium avium]